MNNIVVDINLNNTLIYKNNKLIKNEANLVLLNNKKIKDYGSSTILNKESINVIELKEYNLYSQILKKMLKQTNNYYFKNIIITSNNKELNDYLRKSFNKKNIYVLNKNKLLAVGNNINIYKSNIYTIISIIENKTIITVISLGQILDYKEINIGYNEFNNKILKILLKKYKDIFKNKNINNITSEVYNEVMKNKKVRIDIKNNILIYNKINKDIYKYITSSIYYNNIKDCGIYLNTDYLFLDNYIDSLKELLEIPIIKLNNDKVLDGGIYLLNNINLINN